MFVVYIKNTKGIKMKKNSDTKLDMKKVAKYVVLLHHHLFREDGKNTMNEKENISYLWSEVNALLIALDGYIKEFGRTNETDSNLGYLLVLWKVCDERIFKKDENTLFELFKSLCGRRSEMYISDFINAYNKVKTNEDTRNCVLPGLLGHLTNPVFNKLIDPELYGEFVEVLENILVINGEFVEEGKIVSVDFSELNVSV
jgi:hypothetical protein